MDISRVNGLLDQVRVRLESLDEDTMELQVGADYENNPDRLAVAKGRLDHLMQKLRAGRENSNQIQAYGTR